MKWESWGKYAKKSGKYSICKIILNGKPIYELWKLPKTFLGKYENYEQAKISAMDAYRAESALPDRESADEAGLLKKMGSDYKRAGG